MAISLVAIGCAITFVLTCTVSLNIYNSKIGSSQKYEGVYAKLQEIDSAVRNNYIGQLNDDSLENGVLNGYVMGIGDRYASYMGAASYYELKQTTDGVILGAGIDVSPDGSGYLLITNVYANSSAELNGVKTGDVITAIDGESLLSMQSDKAMDKLSGEIGTRIALKLLRNGDELSVNLIRQQLEIESVSGEVVNDKIGYVKISAFNAKTPEQFSDTLNRLYEQGIGALILDVRQNGGGIVSALKPMLNKFIPAAVVAVAEYSDKSRKTLVETDAEEYSDIPIVILVDGGTASAAELFAVALRDECGAQLVGTQTYGKALMQNTFEFSDGSAVTISTAKIYPSKSDSWDGVGLKPDYATDLPAGTLPENLTHETDSQFIKAVEIASTLAP